MCQLKKNLPETSLNGVLEISLNEQIEPYYSY